ncbi:DUF3365 domain-containing protein [Mangrovimicrobium sediminis]|uniref:DUF3365 domain-containing protein n=1 Tax=Mangrovimicrobium sediminis TaxID=2562682 RepID=A0A4Z0M5R9_9GAMM|nr:DUF3365 domain-containing protein [Haliea sp. SAOS-164]TGD74839.1 DUF3365 domain-containing protein [Haliea sp. SAOS-164]
MRRTLAAALFLGLAVPALAEEDTREARSQALAAEFQQTLGGKLQAAIASGGPVAAIGVCSEAAPAVAAELSERSGADVSRTALRTRNPDNAADADARATMERFAADLSGAAANTALESFTVHEDGSARYMKSIDTAPKCLLCHGDNLAPVLRDEIARQYPQDTATGFSAGELRGAFLIDWPATPD